MTCENCPYHKDVNDEVCICNLLEETVKNDNRCICFAAELGDNFDTESQN